MRRLVLPLLGLLLAICLLLFDLTILWSGRTAIRPVMQKGVALGVFKASEGMSYYRSSLEDIAALGASHLSVPVFILQDSVDSVTHFTRPSDGATGEQHERVIREVIDFAHRMGLKVMLTPIVNLDRPGKNEWRGTISPHDWEAWFESYRGMVRHYARLATEMDVEYLSVGTELVSAERFTGQWRETIADVRGIFPGQLTYSANWDRYDRVAFWDDLDFAGISAYYELSDYEDPTVEQLVAAWRPVKEGLLSWQARWNKPLLFTEIGYMSQSGVASHPWNYVSEKPLDLEAQRRCYEALRLAWEGEERFAGLYLWIWEPEKRGGQDRGYNFAGKPAEEVVRDWYHSVPDNANVLDYAVNGMERFLRSLRQGL
ncbi:MAG: hypothetical protein OXO51_17485 [Gemmatimonadota bacterium]|nr:hypothetical protein [Gemmatimonadota bacterium]